MDIDTTDISVAKPITVLAFPRHRMFPFGERENFHVCLNAIPEEMVDDSVGDGPAHTEAVTTKCYAFNEYYITWIVTHESELEAVLREAVEKYPFYWRGARVIVNFPIAELDPKTRSKASRRIFEATRRGVSVYDNKRHPCLEDLAEEYSRFVGAVEENPYDGIYDPDHNNDSLIDQAVKYLDNVSIRDITDVEMDANEDEPTQCGYRFIRGLKRGQRCSNQALPEGDRCHDHLLGNSRKGSDQRR